MLTVTVVEKAAVYSYIQSKECTKICCKQDNTQMFSMNS